jgi:hypothetical protein
LIWLRSGILRTVTAGGSPPRLAARGAADVSPSLRKIATDSEAHRGL